MQAIKHAVATKLKSTGEKKSCFFSAYSADIVYMYNSVYPSALHTVRGDCSHCHYMSYEKEEQSQKRGALHNVDL